MSCNMLKWRWGLQISQQMWMWVCSTVMYSQYCNISIVSQLDLIVDIPPMMRLSVHCIFGQLQHWAQIGVHSWYRLKCTQADYGHILECTTGTYWTLRRRGCH